MYFFYKNLTFTLTQFWFTFQTGFSGQRFYDDWFQSLYNVIFTALPVIFVGLFDKVFHFMHSRIFEIISSKDPKFHFFFTRMWVRHFPRSIQNSIKKEWGTCSSNGEWWECGPSSPSTSHWSSTISQSQPVEWVTIVQEKYLGCGMSAQWHSRALLWRSIFVFSWHAIR